MKDRKYDVFPYASREERNRFLAIELASYIGQSVLNVGGGGCKHLKKYLSEDVHYVEVDIAGEPDHVLDLEKTSRLPFEDRTFDTVVCTDVLEHVDNLHQVFQELFRVSNRFVIISLPNCQRSFPAYVLGKASAVGEEALSQNGRFSRFYGLPYEKPVDRHKWFFNYTEAEDFVEHHAGRVGFRLVENFGLGYETCHPFGKVLRWIVQLFLGPYGRKNTFNECLWCVLERV